MSFFLETNISGKDLSLFKSINFKLSASCVSTAHITAVTNFLRVTSPESFNLHIQPIHFAYTRSPTKVTGKGEKEFFFVLSCLSEGCLTLHNSATKQFATWSILPAELSYQTQIFLKTQVI